MPANPENAKGVDLSMWNVTTLDNNNNRIVHSIDLVDDELDFVFLRSSVGYNRDIAFQSLLHDTRRVGIRGAYHYSYVVLDWKRQADVFLEAVDGAGLHMLALDYESIGNTLNRASDDDALRTIDYLEAQSGLPVFLYTGLASAADMYTRGSKWVLDVPLWAARWFWNVWYNVPTTNSPYSSYRPGWAPASFWNAAKWDIWQYGGDKASQPIPGQGEGAAYGVLSHSIDLNVYNGSLEKMRTDLGISETPPDPPPVDPVPGVPEAIRDLERRVSILESHHLVGTVPPPASTPAEPGDTNPKVTFNLTGDHGGAIDAYEDLGDRPGSQMIGKFGKQTVVEDLGGRHMGTDWMQVRGPLLGEGGSHIGWINKRQATLVPTN